MKRKVITIILASMFITGTITGCQQEKQAVEKTTTSEKTEEPKNEVIAEKSLKVTQNKPIPLSDVVSAIRNEKEYRVKEISLTYNKETSTIKTDEKFMDLKKGALIVTIIEGKDNLMDKNNVPNVSLTFAETTKESQDLKIDVTFIDEQKNEVKDTVVVKIDVVAENEKSEKPKENKPSEEKKPEENKPSKETNTSGGENAVDNSNSSGGGNTSAGDGNSSSGGNNSGSSGGNTQSEPSHTHNWVAHTATRQVWVPNIVVVDDYETQNVKVGFKTVCNCGAEFMNSPMSAEHAMNHILAGEPDNHWTEDIYEQQSVKVGSHEEDHGYYKDETYTDYTYCSDCGARQ